jgi:hypothetical protein
MLPLEWKYTAALLEARRQAAGGGLRDRIRFDLEGRAPYAWGLLTAADLARFVGIARITAVEFGVARGDGLIELCRIAQLVGAETGVTIDVVGFDTGIGLPSPRDYRDHPEIWGQGGFPMLDADGLRSRLPPSARLVLGDIAETIGGFVKGVSAAAPIGFCVFDTDFWSSTVAALQIYDGPADAYVPAGIAYFDDTLGGAGNYGALFRNAKAGQLLAIEEFNCARSARAIDAIRVLRYRRPLSHEQWLDQVYGVHVLDHPFRSKASPAAAQRDKASRRWPI